MCVFSYTFPVLWKSTLPMFWELHGFLFYPKYLRNPCIWNVCVFPYFSYAMEIYFRHVLEIVWISASSEVFKKSINLKCFYFLVFFLYYRNPPSSCFGNFMGFCVTLNIWELDGFLHVLEILRVFVSPEIFKKFINFKCLCFPVHFRNYGNLLSPCFGNSMDSCLT